MLSNLKAQPADKILALMAAYREDPRPGKVDLVWVSIKTPMG